MTTERVSTADKASGRWCAACGQAAVREVPPWWLCEPCAAALEKYRSIAIHAEPWGLREARRGGFAKY